jgi:predicted nucleic acid-binding protein
MVVDASVWVGVFHTGDVHHEIALLLLHQVIAKRVDVHVPNLALAEVAGVFARQTGSSAAARRTVRAVLSVPGLQRHGFDDELADQACAIAGRCRLRGADAVYVALAAQLRVPLVSLDQEILERAARIVSALTPADWLKLKPKGPVPV